MACNLAELAEASKCFDGMSDRRLEMAKTYLLCQLVDTGLGSGAVMQGSGDPTGLVTPADPTSAAIYTDLDTGILYTWNVVTQAWI